MELRLTTLDIISALNEATKEELSLLQKVLTIRVEYPNFKIDPRRDHQPSKNIRCSFCGKSQDEVEKIIAGPDSFICNECIDICNEIIAEPKKEDSPVTVEAPLPEKKRPAKSRAKRK
jgi:hypothetical protein